ncbi:MAG TPA: D-alanyl-D-alanine carboxypeptidase [Cyanobacteria bacterium UBA8803]|nr:D-alanyl-D-alanine carboxypeptidase [Cyanobacteria bacterium UBA9273]HBL62770.1 D-alanyl-D-alanine carboxypeptidase [Cyanobacteria bacterium UBA8803]
MLKYFRLTAALSLTLLSLVAGCSPPPSISQTETVTEPGQPAEEVKKPEIPQIASPDLPDPVVQQKIEQYFSSIAAKGFAKQSQGIWIQAGNTLLANYQGTTPLPAASITKVATSLAALQTFGPDHQFITQIGATGPIENGVLKGDLVIQGGEDPFFVWEEAIAIGNLLNQMGIKQVTGNLVIVGKFYMNFDFDSLKSGNFLKQGLNAQIWPAAAQTQYQTLPPDTPKPQVAIAGGVQVSSSTPGNVKPLIRHYSFPLAELLKKMNQYSNNPMAEMIANAAGGAKVVSLQAAEAAGVPQAEITLVNGSGLSELNRISPRAACAMFLALERYLQPYNMTVGDLFAIVGQDEGILNQRQIPPLTVVKSGSLNTVSALAGALPTQQQGIVWFATMNGGNNLEGFRAQQEALLQDFISQWGAVPSLPEELQPNPERASKTSRSEVVN